MASHVVVIASDLRRTTIKVTPGTYLSDVLQEACKKLNLSSTKFLLKHKQRQVDLSIPFRTSGLSPGAKLELVQKSKSPAVIQVALQVPPPEGREIPGGRLIQKFPSDLTIWQVLRQFESGKASNGRNVNITGRGVAEMVGGAASGSGQLYYEIPVLNIMGRELSTFPDFQKTLSQLGYNSGNVLIRLSYKKTAQTLFDAMTEIGQFFQHAEEATEQAPRATSSAAATGTGEREEEQMPVQEAETAEQATTESANVEGQGAEDAEPTTAQPQGKEMDVDKPERSDPLQPVTVFLAPSGSTPAAALAQTNEADFMPSIAHAQIHQARLLESSRNKRLPSDRELEEKAAAERARLNAVTSILVKVRFPDNTSSDWQVSPKETGHFLYQAVRHVMAHEDQPFHLILPGGKTVKDDASPRNTLIQGYKITGRVLVNFAWEDSVPVSVRKQPFLKAAVAQQGQEIKLPEMIQPTSEETAEAPKHHRPEKGESSADKLGKKMPKWLKLGKK